jgi:hypothetical protein
MEARRRGSRRFAERLVLTVCRSKVLGGVINEYRHIA